MMILLFQDIQKYIIYQYVVHYRTKEAKRNIYYSEGFNTWDELCEELLIIGVLEGRIV